MNHANTGCYAVDRGGVLLSVIFSACIVIRKYDHVARCSACVISAAL
jgi:hypothetical protein